VDNLLNGKLACLTSKHAKHKAVSKPLTSLTGLNVEEVAEIDTDQLGTFSGEVERQGSPSTVVLKKARLGAEKRAVRFGLATEGSFGPHPSMPFIPSHLEVVGFVDLETAATITEHHMTTKTNFSARDIAPEEDATRFLKSVQFPSHGVIVRSATPKSSGDVKLFKGIQDYDEVRRAVLESASASLDGKAKIETDMRAYLNPTRQVMIRIAARKLARRLSELCGRCSYPGWGPVRNIAGLECEECGVPTRWVKFVVFGCAHCQHELEMPRTDGLLAASGDNCEICNP
jgi:hypothetical protein